MRYIGRERYLEALAHAAAVFPSGTVWSDLVLGAEAHRFDMAAIDALAAIGVVPVASIPVRDRPPLDPAALPRARAPLPYGQAAGHQHALGAGSDARHHAARGPSLAR